MRIAVIGSGGIGGYYGALLAKAGHDVVFVARGSHLEAMQRHGLTLRTPGGETTVPVTAVADTGRVEPVDLVLFCVKSYDTESAAPLLRPLMGRDTTVLTFQNGVDNADTIGSWSDPTPCFRARSTSRSSSSAPAWCSAPAVRDGWSSASSTGW
jgi:2-dehydropantoate 2-reductase